MKESHEIIVAIILGAIVAMLSFECGAAIIKMKLSHKETISQSGVYTTYSAVRRYGK